MNSDFKDLLKLFDACEVRYLVVGGYAVMKYGEPRYTKDLDVWIDATSTNARTVFKALKEFGAPLLGLTEGDFAQPGSIYQMGRPPVRIDILTSIEGVLFDVAWSSRVETDFDGVSAHLISLHHLILNKRTLARPQDLIDVNGLIAAEKNLDKLKGERKSKKGDSKNRGEGVD